MIKHRKKVLGVLGALLAILIVTTVILTLHSCQNGSRDPDDSRDPGQTSASAVRPKDPGVVKPLVDSNGIPEDGVVWDMESLVPNLYEAGWAECEWTNQDAWKEGNVALVSVDGKGYQGSRALGICQNGPYSWADVYRVGLRKDKTASTRWGEGKYLWIWYDNTEMKSPILLELGLNDENMAKGHPYYVMEDGADTAFRGGSIPEAYTGADYGRVPLQANAKGWVGIPLEAFGESYHKVSAVKLHLAYNGEVPVGKTLYLDNFCVTGEGQGPMGAKLSDQNIKLATSHRAAWDMENLPDDLVAAYWATMVGAEWDSFKAGNIRVLGAKGKGAGGSRGLRVHQVGPYNGADLIMLNLTMDSKSYTDWSQGDVLWFWVDTRELRNDVSLDLFLNEKKPRIGAAYYGINSEKKIESVGTAGEAYTGAGYGRFTIGAGYCGWVGIPLGAYPEKITDVSSISLHLAYNGDASNEDKSVYFDEFWVLKNGEKPKTATPGDMAMLKGGNNGVSTDVGAAPSLPCEVWSMENLPADVIKAGWAYAAYGTQEEYKAGNVQLLKAPGKGYKKSAALELKQNGAYSWIDCFRIDLSKDDTAVRNWAGGKVLWVYVDASEPASKVMLDLSVDGIRPAMNAQWYLVPEGERAASRQKLEEAYTGAGYGRLGFPTHFTGWIGLPLDSFQQTLTRGSLLEIHAAYGNSEEKGRSVYLDAFYVTADNTCPNGVKVKEPEPEKTATSKASAWDMEGTPANLTTAGWAVPKYEDQDAFIANNVQFLGMDKKGRNGSRALEISFEGAYSWADVYDLRPKADSTAATDWSKGQLLWMWLDASDMQVDFEIELSVNGTKAVSDAGCYEVIKGKAVRAGELNIAWDESGRIPVKAGYVGFIGIPLSAYGKVESVDTLTVHFAGDGVQKGRKVYLDELWVTGLSEIPVNAKDGYIHTSGSGEEQTNLPLEVWSMEAIPANLVTAGVAEAKYPKEGAYQEGNVTFKKAPGKGQGDSQALAIRQNGSYSWADVFQLYLSKDAMAVTNWNGAAMLWMWVDATEFASDLKMDLYIDGRSLKIGAPYYTENGDGTLSMAGRLPMAYDTAAFARIPIAAGYRGYVGLPLSAYTSVPKTANILEVHLAYGDSDQAVGKTLYLDALTISDDKTGPGGRKIVTEEEDDTFVASFDKPAWDMENLPDNLLAEKFATADWKNEDAFTADNVVLLGAKGKGRNGSKALAIRQNGGYSWADEFTLNMTADNTFAYNWSEGDMMMLWVDASEYTSRSLTMEFDINGLRPAADASYYLERNGMLVKAGTLPDAWGGSAGWSRISIPAGFQGWIGVPLSAYGAIHKVDTIKLHVAYDGSSDIAHSLYLDDLWIISGNAMPAGAISKNGGEVTTILNDGQTAGNGILTDIGSLRQTVKAYGISDAWWANAIGQRKNVGDIMKLFYTDDGIGLNQYRINIYGGVKNDHSDGPTYEPVWRAGYSPLGEDGVYSISRNEGSYGAFHALKALTASGAAQIDDYTLFMNTPPSTMTDNGKTYDNNKLKAECYDAYASYVADVVQLYEANGIKVRYVSPINEPMLDAWTGNAGQESCVYTIDQVIAVYEKVIDALESRGLSTKLSLAEFNSWNNAGRYFDVLLGNEKIAGHIDHYTAHDYGGSARVKGDVAKKAAEAGLDVHMSEWCMAISDKADNMATALMLAEMLHEDMTVLNTTSWSWWTGVGHGSFTDGLIYVTENDTVIETTKRFWAYGNFAKFTKNMTRVEVNAENVPEGVSVTAYRSREDRGQLVYVVINNSTSAQTIGLSGLPAGVKARVYETSASHNLDQIGYMNADYSYQLPAESVTTFVFEDIDYRAVNREPEPEDYSEQITAMENLPADLFADGKASSYYPQNVGAVSSGEKGFNKSTALGYVYKSMEQSTSWGNGITVETAALGMKGNWSKAAYLWFWVDASEFGGSQNLELRLNDVCMPAGTEIYFWDGENETEKAQLIDAWAGFGRIPLPAEYEGFVGVPLAGFTKDSDSSRPEAVTLDVKDIHSMYLYIEPWDDADRLPRTLYLDEFWLTDETNLPKVEVKKPETYAELVTDMERLSGDLFETTIPGAWEPVAGTMWNSANVGAVMADGKGFGGSKAISYVVKDQSKAAWNDNIFLRFNWMTGEWKYPCDMSNGDIFWFWVDTEEFGQELLMDVWMAGADYNCDKKPATGTVYYTWNGSSKKAQTQQMPEAYTDAGYGRVKLPANYKGFIGIPLSAMSGLDSSNITWVMYYLALPGGLPAGEKHLYLDEFWLTKEDSLPGVKQEAGALAGIGKSVLAYCLERGIFHS